MPASSGTRNLSLQLAYLAVMFGAGCRQPVVQEPRPDISRSQPSSTDRPTPDPLPESPTEVAHAGEQPSYRPPAESSAHTPNAPKTPSPLTQTAGEDWLAQITGEGTELPGHLAIRSDGAVIVAGSFTREIDVGGRTLTAPHDHAFVVQYSPSGQPVWTQMLAGEGDTIVEQLQLLPEGGMMLAGRFYRSLSLGRCTATTANGPTTFVMRLDRDGTCQWVRTLERDDFAAKSPTKPSADPASEFSRGFWVEWIETQRIEDSRQSNYLSHFAQVDPDGNTTATFVLPTTGMLTTVSAHPRGMVISGFFDRVVNVVGKTLKPPTPHTKTPRVATAIGLLDTRQSIRWLHTFDDVLHRKTLVDSATGAIFVVGRFEGRAKLGNHTVHAKGKRDLVVSKFTKSGKVEWATVMGGHVDEGVVVELALDSRGHLWLASDYEQEITIGAHHLTAPKSNAYNVGEFLVELDHRGAPGTVIPLAGSISDFAFDRHDSVLMCGQAPDPFQLKSWQFDPVGDRDGFVAKLASPRSAKN